MTKQDAINVLSLTLLWMGGALVGMASLLPGPVAIAHFVVGFLLTGAAFASRAAIRNPTT